ncbi:MAG: hypothetical protein RBR65_02030 [Aliarcobacter sp.]|jgi:hypothetical protein|nr:hypothetical protein [Aliarcobacter sp.]
MFTKESLYINVIKYDSQLRLDYKKIKNEQIIDTNNSIFLVDDDILSSEISQKLNLSQEENNFSYISTLLISDTTKLVPKALSSKLKDCEIAKFNNEFDIAVLKTTLFETKNYFIKTGIDYIYSAFHIMNLHLEKKVCRNELLIFLFNNKAFILIVDQKGLIAFHQTSDLPTFESIKKTHFYEDDVDGQKLFDEIYYLELNEIIHNVLSSFYEKKTDVFVEKITLLYVLKHLSDEQIEQLNDELMLEVQYHPINIDEEIFELSKDKHLKKSFTKPRKKVKKRNYNNLAAIILLILLIIGAYFFFQLVMSKQNNQESRKEQSRNIEKKLELPDHINLNDKIEQRVRAIFDSVEYDIILKELKIEENFLELKGIFLKEDTYITSLKPKLDLLYKTSEYTVLDVNKKVNIESMLISKDVIELENITYKTNTKKYITDELMSIERVSEQLKILMPENSIIKLISSTNDYTSEYKYMVNILVKEPKEFFDLINLLSHELYSINIAYPLSMIRTETGIEIEFKLVFNQPH